MLQIFIAEDDDVQRHRLERLVKNYLLIENMDAEIARSTADPNEIINYLNSQPQTAGLYLFDVNLGHEEYDGIELAARIREIDIFGHVIFITVHSELSYLTFVHKVAALDYIIKDKPDEMEARIKECLQLAYNQYLSGRSKKKEMLVIRVGGDMRPIPYENIIFIETTNQSNKLILHRLSGTLTFRGSMKEIEASYESLYRCDQSYLINVKNVTSICKKTREVFLINGGRVTASVRKIRQLVELVEVMQT